MSSSAKPSRSTGDVTDVVVDEDTVVTEVVEDEMLIEEISIDGMCGVY